MQQTLKAMKYNPEGQTIMKADRMRRKNFRILELLLLVFALIYLNDS